MARTIEKGSFKDVYELRLGDDLAFSGGSLSFEPFLSFAFCGAMLSGALLEGWGSFEKAYHELKLVYAFYVDCLRVLY